MLFRESPTKGDDRGPVVLQSAPRGWDGEGEAEEEARCRGDEEGVMEDKLKRGRHSQHKQEQGAQGGD